MNSYDRVAFALFVGRLSDNLLIHMESWSWRRYAAFGKFACRTEEQEAREEKRQTEAWIQSAICRMEIERRRRLEL